MTPAEALDEVVEALSSLDLNVYDHIPGKAALPSAIVLVGNPLWDEGPSFGSRVVHFEVWLSAEKGDNQSETRQLLELSESVYEVLKPLNWVAETATQPFEFQINNGSAFTTALVVSAQLT